MNTTLRTTTVTLLFIALAVGGQVAPAEETGASEDASVLVHRMLTRLGGSDLWAEARTLKVTLRGYYAREPEPWNEIFWLDLEAPNGRFEIEGEDIDRTIVWTRDGGWEISGGQLETMPDSRHDLEMEYWRRQPAVIFRRLARAGTDTRIVIADEGRRLEVFDVPSGELLAEFGVNLQGEPTSWKAQLGERDLQHVLGPLEDFGRMRFPRWGASSDGVWRYEHVAVELSPSPLPVSLEPPASTEGDGG